MTDKREMWLVEYRFGLLGGRWWTEWDRAPKIADAQAMKKTLQVKYPDRDWRIRRGIPKEK